MFFQKALCSEGDNLRWSTIRELGLARFDPGSRPLHSGSESVAQLSNLVPSERFRPHLHRSEL